MLLLCFLCKNKCTLSTIYEFPRGYNTHTRQVRYILSPEGGLVLEMIRRRNIDGDLQDQIEVLARRGWTPAQIDKHLDKKIKEGGKDPPDIRTIRGIVKDVQSSDTSGRWSIIDSEPENARTILDFLAGCTDDYPSPIGTLSKAEAEWVVRLSKAAPGASSRIIATLMHLYMSRQARGIADVSDLDGYLAFRPWESSDKLRLYKRAVVLDIVPMVPPWEVLVEDISRGEFSDPRFIGTTLGIYEFEKDICKRYKGGESLDSIADRYDVHVKDIDEILRCHRAKEGGEK